MSEIDDDGQVYRAVANHEEQYSIWPVSRELPAGWREAGKEGSKSECLSYIEEVWTDMRPLSLRRHMEELERNPPPEAAAEQIDDAAPLVERLSSGKRAVRFMSRPERTADALRRSLERGYVHLLFHETQGGTELGIRIDTSDLSAANFAAASGEVTFAGRLKLDGTPIQCNVQLDVSTLEGQASVQALN